MEVGMISRSLAKNSAATAMQFETDLVVLIESSNLPSKVVLIFGASNVILGAHKMNATFEADLSNAPEGCF